jgi:ribosome maturation factor RimP
MADVGSGGNPDGAVDVVGQVRAIASRVAASYGIEIFDVQFRREAGGMILRIQIDRPGPAATAGESVSVEDCANVSRDVSAILDVEEIVPSAFILEVSSPGLDRPLRSTDDYRRFTGRLAKLVTREPIDGQTFLRGTLAGVEEGYVIVDGEDHKRHRVPVAAIRRANLEVEF